MNGNQRHVSFSSLVWADELRTRSEVCRTVNGAFPGLLVLLDNLLCQVILISDFINLMKLCFDPIDVFLLIHNNVLQKLSRGVIRGFNASFYSRMKNRQCRSLEGKIVFKLLFHV